MVADRDRDVGRAFDLLMAEQLLAETGHQVASPDQLSAAVKFLRDIWSRPGLTQAALG